MQNPKQYLLYYPKTVLALILVISLGAGFLYTKLPVETSVESLIIENDPDLLFYNTFKQEFGEDEFVVVGFKHEQLFTHSKLQAIAAITELLETIDEVKEVTSLTNVEDIQGTEYDFFVRPLVEVIPKEKNKLSKIKKRALENPLINGNIVFQNGDAAIFLLRTKPHPDDETYDARLVQKVKKVLDAQDYFPPDTFHLASWVVTDVNMSGYMNQDMAIFMPLTYIMLIVLLFIFLRRIIPVIISIVTVTFCLIWAMAALYLVGGAMSPMTSILPPLIMALAVSDCIHLFTDFLKQDRMDKPVPEVMKHTLKRLWIPCFLTSLTTAIGFLSLSLSDIPPIRHFGLAAASGMIAEFILTMTLIPIGAILFQQRDSLKSPFKKPQSFIDRIVNQLASILPRIRHAVLGISLFMVFLAIYGVFKLEVETDLIEYFREDTQVYQDARFVDRELGGVNTLEISFQSEKNDAFVRPSNLQLIEQVADYLRQQEEVTKVISMNNFLKQMNKSFHNENSEYFALPDSRQMIAQYLLIYGGDELFNFVDRDYQWARLSARIVEHNSEELQAFIRELENFIADTCQECDLDIHVTGKTFLVNKLLERIVDSQITTLATAFVIIFAVLFFVFRSFKLGLLSIIPNSLPILFNLGLMGLIGIPLNTATAIIAAVAIGIAVDDTIHYFTAYQRERRRGITIGEAALHAVRVKGVPMTTTSLILMGAFGILIFSHFVPTIQFGFVCALIMLFALTSDILILPSLLSMIGKKQ